MRLTAHAIGLAALCLTVAGPASAATGLLGNLQCVEVGLGIAPVLAGISFASVYTVSGHPVDWASDGEKAMQDVAGEVSDLGLKQDLQVVGREIGRQQGMAKFTATPALIAGLAGINTWLKANCAQEAGGGTGGPSLAGLTLQTGPGLTLGAMAGKLGAVGPARRPSPVARAASDAPGVGFAELSPGDAAILEAAKGVQMVSTPQKAEIQVIFDPDGPDGAKLYQRLRKTHAFLPVRWVPVALFGKDSAAKAAALLASSSPTSDLDQDLGHFDFSSRTGGALNAAPDAGAVPPPTRALGKAVMTWGGFTPMIVFRDAQGRWLRTGGSDAKVIDSVLARAARD